MYKNLLSPTNHFRHLRHFKAFRMINMPFHSIQKKKRHIFLQNTCHHNCHILLDYDIICWHGSRSLKLMLPASIISLDSLKPSRRIQSWTPYERGGNGTSHLTISPHVMWLYVLFGPDNEVGGGPKNGQYLGWIFPIENPLLNHSCRLEDML